MNSAFKEQFKAKLRKLRDGGYSEASLIVYTRTEVEAELKLKQPIPGDTEQAYHQTVLAHLDNVRRAIDALNELITEVESSEFDSEPITVLDYVRSKVGEKDTYSVEDHYNNGVDIMGGCYRCYASLGSYNAYPSKHGYWSCRDCIGATGFATVEEFDQWQPTEYVEYDD